MKVRLFYRDGDNYKCNWVANVNDKFIKKLQRDNKDFLDPEQRSGITFEIEDLGLKMSDIPLIKEYGQGDMDHNYVSIIEILD